MFCFYNLPHKGAKGQSQTQGRELARTSGQMARLAYRWGEHAPSSSELPLPAMPPSHAPAPKGFWQPWTLLAWQEPQLSTSKERPLKYHFAISNPPRTLDPCHRATNTSAPVHTQDSGALFDFNQPAWRQARSWGCRVWGSAESCWGMHKGRREADLKGVENLQKRETEAQHLPRSWTPRPL